MAIFYRYIKPHGYYTSPVDGQGYDVANAVPVKPTIVAGFWPRWDFENPNADDWEQVEDHRERTANQGFPEEAVQAATQFWLPGDTHDFPARTMKEIGPLPAGAMREAPEMTEAEQDADARAYVLAELAALDAEYLTPRTIAGLAVGDAYALEAYRIHEAKAESWRERLAAIPAAS